MVKWKEIFKGDDQSSGKSKKSRLTSWFEEDDIDFEIEDYTEKSTQQTNTKLETKDVKEQYLEDDDFDVEFKNSDFKEENTQQTSKLSSLKAKIQSSIQREKDNIYLEDDTEYDDYATDEANDENDKQEPFITRFINLFKSHHKTANNQAKVDIDNKTDETDEADEPEDYKTYLEKQKNQAATLDTKENTQKTRDTDTIDFNDDDIYSEDDLFNDDEESIRTKPSLLDKIKYKLSNLSTFSFRKNKSDDETNKDDDIFDDNTTSNETLANEPIEKETSTLSAIMSKITTQTENLSTKENNITNQEEENQTVSLENSLKDYGINLNEATEVDIFSNTRERRVHPTLAGVRVKRILQDKKIDEIGENLVFQDTKDNFTKEIITSKDSEILKDTVLDTHTSKHKAEIEKLNDDFNKIERKADDNSQKLATKTDDNIDQILHQINKSQDVNTDDDKNFDIKISDNDKQIIRRDKLKYTSIDDVLSGNEDLFITDIDKTKNLAIDEHQEISEDIIEFREQVFKEKTSKNLVSDQKNPNALDQLIVDTDIVQSSKTEEIEAITQLEHNLNLLREDKAKKEEIVEIQQEISIKEVAKNAEYIAQDYDEFSTVTKSEKFDDYSDYLLDETEVEELTSKEKIESESEKTNIDSLTRLITSKSIKKELAQQDTLYDDYEDNFKNYEVEKEKLGIAYTEKLYPNDVKDYFVDDNSPLTFGAYKTKDMGYRPVSKETMEEKRKRLDAIFEKYSNIHIPRKNTTAYVEEKLSANKTNFSKYKPSQVISSVYGTNIPKKEKQKVERKTIESKSTKSTNYFKEIAGQDETVWNIDLKSRVPKTKKKK